MPSKKLFLASTILFVLITLPLIGSVGASSEMWSQTYGGKNEDVARSLVETSDGGYALAGHTMSFGAGEADLWLAKTDEHGVIPEFPSWTPLLIMLLAVTAVAIIYRHSLHAQSREGIK